jgi:hypothetical protein
MGDDRRKEFHVTALALGFSQELGALYNARQYKCGYNSFTAMRQSQKKWFVKN